MLAETSTGRLYDDSIPHPSSKDHDFSQGCCIFCIHAYMRDSGRTQTQTAGDIGIATGSFSNYLNRKSVGALVSGKVETWFREQAAQRYLTNVMPSPPKQAPTNVKKEEPPPKKEESPPKKEEAEEETKPTLTRDQLRQRIRAELASPSNWRTVIGDKRGYVYIFADDRDHRLKIGKTDQCSQRIGGLGCGNPDGGLAFTLECRRPLQVEAVAHRILTAAGVLYEGKKGLKYDNKATEWFSVRFSDAAHLLLVIRSKLEDEDVNKLQW